MPLTMLQAHAPVARLPARNISKPASLQGRRTVFAPLRAKRWVEGLTRSWQS